MSSVVAAGDIASSATSASGAEVAGGARPVRIPSRKTLIISSAALIVVAVLATFGRHWWTVGRFMESTDDAYIGGDITVIAPKVSGFIARVAVADNQTVHAGDVLVKLDDRDYVAARARAIAAVAAQDAALANLRATRHLQEAIIAQAQAVITSADAEIERSREDQTRYQRLQQLSAVSLQESQKANADYKDAVASGVKTRAALAASQRQLDVIDSQTQQAQAALAQANADRDVAELNLSYTELRAPMDGTVGNRSARPGSYATIGAQLMSLVPARGLWVDANFKESQLARMHAGQPVFVEADVLPGQVFHGRVASLAPATGAVFSVLPAENATGNFTKIVQRVPVRILLDGDASALGRLRPGLSVVAKVDMRISERADVAAVHTSSPQTTANSEVAPTRASSSDTSASTAGQRSVAPRPISRATPAAAAARPAFAVAATN
jgi:membrane fusion protein (multidrug efflux system)